jgi:hypothetical protein
LRYGSFHTIGSSNMVIGPCYWRPWWIRHALGAQFIELQIGFIFAANSGPSYFQNTLAESTHYA